MHYVEGKENLILAVALFSLYKFLYKENLERCSLCTKAVKLECYKNIP